MTNTRKGVLAEIAFESRLIELGYGPICRPSRVDQGVDFVLFTSKGWIGIQVKAHTVHTKHPSINSRKYTQKALRLDRGKKTERHIRAKTYYQRQGVNVFAAYTDGGFFLIPIEIIEGGEIALSKCRHFWEAWQDVLGLPGELAEAQAQDELHQIEMMWERSP